MTLSAKERVLAAGRRNHHPGMKTTNLLSSLGLGLCFAFPVACVDRIVFPGEGDADGPSGGSAGAEVDGPSGGTGGGGGISGGGCPEALPTAESSCAEEGRACGYTVPNVYCGHRTALCESGVWTIQSPSCPPPSCPEARPAAGGMCEFPGHECSFGSCASEDAVVYSCSSEGLWETRTTDCDCPVDLPGIGDACLTGQSCAYTVPETYCGFRQASCEDGVWNILLPSCPPPQCPETPPTLGTSCEFQWHVCTFGSCGTNDASAVQCGSEGTWEPFDTTCP